MISGVNPIGRGLYPQPALAAGSASASIAAPTAEAVGRSKDLADPGAGGKPHLFHSKAAANGAYPVAKWESLAAPPDFPYLKPLAGENLGRHLDTLS